MYPGGSVAEGFLPLTFRSFVCPQQLLVGHTTHPLIAPNQHVSLCVTLPPSVHPPPPTLFPPPPSESWDLPTSMSLYVTLPPFSPPPLPLFPLLPSESWDLRGLSPPAAAAATASRMLWSAQSAGKDASDAVGRAAAESLGSLSSQDEDEYYMNPTDPTRVSRQGGGVGGAPEGPARGEGVPGAHWQLSAVHFAVAIDRLRGG